MAGASPAAAQSSEESILNPPPRELQPIGLRLGRTLVYPTLLVAGEYDSNIYAEDENTNSDRILHILPTVRAVQDGGNWRLRWLAQAHVRRFARNSSENSTAGVVEGEARFSPREGQSYRALLAYRRLIEDRGDPEARRDNTRGPRRLNGFGGELEHNREVGRWLFSGLLAGDKFDYLAGDDRVRDHLSLGGTLTAGRQVGGFTYAAITGFVNRRAFDQEFDQSGFQRDATTFGARAGLQINPGGLFDGSASAGLFSFRPDDSRIDSYSGLSLAANMNYRPTQRLALSLVAFRGNVATYRSGATARTDTRVALRLQQEIRHNLYANAGVFFRKSEFRGSGTSQDTRGIDGELEYLVSRRVGITAWARAAKRTSDLESEDFGRFRGGLGLRLRY
jgi:hypothetical protein